MITLGTLFLICACISFFLGALSVALPRINWLCLGFAFWVLAALFGTRVLPL